MQEDDPNTLAGNYREFNDPIDAVQEVASIGPDGGGSAISEAIWKTWLEIDRSAADGYDGAVLILISDAEEIWEGSAETDGLERYEPGKFFNSDNDFSNFFADSDVHLLDVGTTDPDGDNPGEPFEIAFYDAGFQVHHTDSDQHFRDELAGVLAPLTEDWVTALIAALIVGITVLIALCIHPKSLNSSQASST